MRVKYTEREGGGVRGGRTWAWECSKQRGGKPIENFCTLHHVTKGPTNEAEGKGIHAFLEGMSNVKFHSVFQTECLLFNKSNNRAFFLYLWKCKLFELPFKGSYPHKTSKMWCVCDTQNSTFFWARKKDLIMAVSADVIKTTQQNLGKFIKKPPLTEKLLTKPPFRYVFLIYLF